VAAVTTSICSPVTATAAQSDPAQPSAMHLRGSALTLLCGFAEAKEASIIPQEGLQKPFRILRPQLHKPRRGRAEGGEISLKSWASFRPYHLQIPAICKAGARRPDRAAARRRKSLRCGQSRAPRPLQKPPSPPGVCQSVALGSGFLHAELGSHPAAERHAFTSKHRPLRHLAHEVIHLHRAQTPAQANLSGAMGLPQLTPARSWSLSWARGRARQMAEEGSAWDRAGWEAAGGWATGFENAHG